MTQSRTPHWDIDVAFGEQGEDTVRAVLGMTGDRIEVKHKRWIDLDLYVETHCDYGARGEYCASGISITRAEYFAYVVGDTGIVLFLPTTAIRAALTHRSARPMCAPHGTCPTRGKLINLGAILVQCRDKIIPVVNF